MKPFFKNRLLKKTLADLEQSLVVVEGNKDENALRQAYSGCRIVKMRGLSAGKTVELAQRLGFEKIVLLVDFDEEGKRKEKQLKQALAEHGLRASDSTRKNFRELFRINTVEQLPRALERLEQELDATKGGF